MSCLFIIDPIRGSGGSLTDQSKDPDVFFYVFYFHFSVKFLMNKHSAKKQNRLYFMLCIIKMSNICYTQGVV